MRITAFRLLTLLAAALGAAYLAWRATATLAHATRWLALPALAAELVIYGSLVVYAALLWRLGEPASPHAPAPDGLTVDVFALTRDESASQLARRLRAIRALAQPHTAYVLDGAASPTTRELAAEHDCQYLDAAFTLGRAGQRARADLLNEALQRSDGAIALLLAEGEAPRPELLGAALGAFADERVAYVQLALPGVESPLDRLAQRAQAAWGVAPMRGSALLLRREALAQLGVRRFVLDEERRVRAALETAERMLAQVARSRDARLDSRMRIALGEMRGAVSEARALLADRRPLQDVVSHLGRRIQGAERLLARNDLAALGADLAALADLDPALGLTLDDLLGDYSGAQDELALRLAESHLSPLGAIGAVRALMEQFDSTRNAGAALALYTLDQPGENVVVALGLNALGWRGVYDARPLLETQPPRPFARHLRDLNEATLGYARALLSERTERRGFLAALRPGQRFAVLAPLASVALALATLLGALAPLLVLVTGARPLDTTLSGWLAHLAPALLAGALGLALAARLSGADGALRFWRSLALACALAPQRLVAFVRGALSGLRSPEAADAPEVVPFEASAWRGEERWSRLIGWQLAGLLAQALAVAAGGARLLLGATADRTGIGVYALATALLSLPLWQALLSASRSEGGRRARRPPRGARTEAALLDRRRSVS